MFCDNTPVGSGALLVREAPSLIPRFLLFVLAVLFRVGVLTSVVAVSTPSVFADYSPDPNASVHQPGICWFGSYGHYQGPLRATAGEALEDYTQYALEVVPANVQCYVMKPNGHGGWVIDQGPSGGGEPRLEPVGSDEIVYEKVNLSGSAQRVIQFWGQSGGPCTSANGGAIGVRDGQRNALGEAYRCPTPYTIKLSRPDGSLQDGPILASVVPGKGAPLLARIYTSDDRLVPNAEIELWLEAVVDSGGHHHGDNTKVERTGKLGSSMEGAIVSNDGKTVAGNTGPTGFEFGYKAPAVSGDINIRGRCTDGRTCTVEGPKQVWVGVKDLQHVLGLSSDYRLIGETSFHPHNHFLSSRALDKLVQLTAAYKLIVVDTAVPLVPVLHLNDASLERGGIFDISCDNEKGTCTWARPHAEHCMGAVIDIRGNDLPGAIPPENHEIFQEITNDLDIEAMWEIPKDGQGNRRLDLRHFHVRLLGKEGLQCPW